MTERRLPRTSAKADKLPVTEALRMTVDPSRLPLRDATSNGGCGSPLAAFDATSDSALVLDVARYKYPAVWVPSAQLYAGSQAVDNVSRLSRGLVIVSKR
nr:phytochelatin synthase family protein [Caballeronia sp. SEWSISQ10-4 2]